MTETPSGIIVKRAEGPANSRAIRIASERVAAGSMRMLRMSVLSHRSVTRITRCFDRMRARI